ncbi:MAG: hypothetical protein WBV23_09805 [Desulfobaccales bacterium]
METTDHGSGVAIQRQGARQELHRTEVTGDQDNPLASLQRRLKTLLPGKPDPGFQEFHQPGKIRISNEQLLMVMVEDSSENRFDLPIQEWSGKFSLKNMVNGFPDQGFLRTVQKIVKPSHDHKVPSGDGEGEETEQKAVQSHLHKFA